MAEEKQTVKQQILKYIYKFRTINGYYEIFNDKTIR